MDILFSSDRLGKLCNDSKQLQRRYGPDAAKKVRLRLDALRSAACLEVMRGLPGRCHELVGNREGQLAVDLGNGLRLVFTPAEEPVPRKEDGGLDWSRIESVTIVEIVDYHE